MSHGPPDELHPNDPSRESPGESRARRLVRRLRRREPGRGGLWRAHLLSFGAVNAFLAFLNFVTPSAHPWVLYVTGAWAIPLTVHAIWKRRRDKLQQRLERWLGAPVADSSGRSGVAPGADLPDAVFRPLRKLHGTVSSFLVGLGVAGSVSGYLALVNILTGGSAWSAIPIASIALPVFLWSLLIPGRRKRLRAQLDAARSEASLPDPGAPPAAHPAVRDARDLRDRIVRLVDENAPSQTDLIGHVDDIVGEIERLAGLEARFAEARSVLPVAELQDERGRMAERARALAEQGPGSASVVREYETSLEQIDKQIQGLRELEQRHELLEMRLRNGVSSLRQVSLDLVRYQGEQALNELDAQLTAKADELSRQVSDMQTSYAELSHELRSPSGTGGE
ncbi:MAG: 2TM domain-containing protein [Spirochaetota bacterium]